MLNLKKQIAGFCSVVAAAGAWASPTTFFIEDQAPSQAVTAPVLAKHNLFTSNLAASVQSYGFENRSNGDTAPFNVNFAGSGSTTITATMQGDGAVVNTATAGRFNTTATPGTNYWRSKAGGVGTGVNAGSFSIAFNTAISAFGFYATDVGDFEGGLSLVLSPASGPDVTMAVPNTVGAASGSLLFFGFFDAAASYTKITFLTSGSSTTADFFGFDDFIVADRGQISAPGTIPEPTSLALAGLALAAAGFAARRNRRA